MPKKINLVSADPEDDATAQDAAGRRVRSAISAHKSGGAIHLDVPPNRAVKLTRTTAKDWSSVVRATQLTAEA